MKLGVNIVTSGHSLWFNFLLLVIPTVAMQTSDRYKMCEKYAYFFMGVGE
jgi:hypothetical protein